MTVIVCDTGEINAIKKFTPQDATTNPSLLLKAALLPEYEKYLKDAIGMIYNLSLYFSNYHYY